MILWYLYNCIDAEILKIRDRQTDKVSLWNTHKKGAIKKLFECPQKLDKLKYTNITKRELKTIKERKFKVIVWVKINS